MRPPRPNYCIRWAPETLTVIKPCLCLECALASSWGPVGSLDTLRPDTEGDGSPHLPRGSTLPLPKIFGRWKEVGTSCLCVPRTETYQMDHAWGQRFLWPPHICTHMRPGKGNRELRGDKGFWRFELLAWPAKPVDKCLRCPKRR